MSFEREEFVPVYVKELNLITPEKAGKLGIVTEAPIFVSPYTKTDVECTHCHQTYSPLVYRRGQITTSQHFHDLDGGIYVHKVSEKEGDFTIPEDFRSNFRALVQPLGRTISERWEFRSENVLVTDIFPFPYNGKNFEDVQGGVLMEHNDGSGILIPLTDNAVPLFSRYFTLRYYYHLKEDGSIVYSLPKNSS